MVKFKDVIFSYPSANCSNFLLSVISEYSKFNKLCKSDVSKGKSKMFCCNWKCRIS